jgi:tRNA A-37 threonylcarbamoyl transferase component Bud32
MPNNIHPEENKLPIRMDDETKAILRSKTVPGTLDVRGRKYYPKEYKAEGVKGVVWQGKDEYDQTVAIKFTIHEDYMDRSYLEEASRARNLSSSDYFARFLDAGITEIPWINGETRKFVIFVEDWVNGFTLPKYIDLNGATPSFFLSYVNGMCGALGVLAAKGYRHDDLKPDNVMIMEPEQGDISRELKVKVIDTGSMKQLSSPKRKPKDNQPWFREDDYQWFAEHLLLIRNVLFHSKPLSLHEARFIKEIDPLLDRMFEEDRGVALWAPGRVCAEFTSAWTRAQATKAEMPIKLTDPFDYIAAEHIVSDELLLQLYSDSCPWYAEISSPNPLLLTGPRGCGKSMAFRRMSLKALLHKSMEEISASQIAGFYVSCSGDLRNRLGWLQSDRAAQKFRNEILHYFNLLIAREIFQTLSIIATREDRQSLFGFGINEEKLLHEYLMTQLHLDEPEQRRLQGMSRMEHAIDIIDQKMDDCYRIMRMGMTAPDVTAAPFLSSIIHVLHKNIKYFRDRKTTLLIDDFSVHKLPGPVQSILNVVLWDRQGTYVSKVSAEKYGAVGVDKLKATSEIGKELREFDCGRYYLDANKADTRNFAKDLLGIRLQLAGYEGTPSQLIGSSKWPEGSLGRALRDKQKHRGGKNNQYHGMETIADLCSGDISNLLEVYRRIFERGKVKQHTTERVPAHIQHGAIQSVSGDLFELIRNYTPFGLEMYLLVQSFGNLSRLILQKAPLLGQREDVPQTARIEVEPASPGQPTDDPGTAQQEFMDELVRRTIFIEMQPGRSRHQFVTTLRWQLRKIYCPIFGTSIHKTTSIRWRPDEFKFFLLDPKTSCETEFNKVWSGKKSDKNDDQLNLCF